MVGLHFEYSSFTVGWIKLSYKNSTNWFTVGILTHVRWYISLKWFFNYEVKIFEMTASLFLSCIENTGHRHYCVAHFWSWSDVDIILEGLLLLELWEISVLLMWNDEVYFILWKTYSLCKKFRMSDALLLFYYDKTKLDDFEIAVLLKTQPKASRPPGLLSFWTVCCFKVENVTNRKWLL